MQKNTQTLMARTAKIPMPLSFNLVEWEDVEGMGSYVEEDVEGIGLHVEEDVEGIGPHVEEDVEGVVS